MVYRDLALRRRVNRGKEGDVKLDDVKSLGDLKTWHAVVREQVTDLITFVNSSMIIEE